MNALFNRSLQTERWLAIAMLALAFWLSGSLLFDVIILPSLAAAGMTVQPEFASLGYVLFGAFNRLELLCGSVVAVAIAAASYQGHWRQQQWSPVAVAAGVLLAIVAAYTYWLAPQMSALDAPLSWLAPPAEPMSGTMLNLQWLYWLLDGVKLALGGWLLYWCARHR